MLVSSSCENEVDINADYQEITIVYGLLNQTEARQYIKVTKAFQTEGNVLVAAKDPANSMYDPKDLEVWMDEYLGNSYKGTIYLDSVLITNKDSGDFYYPNEIVYATPPGTKLNPLYEYRLNIKVKSTGRLIEGRTRLIRDFMVTRPLPQQEYVSFTGNYNQQVVWESAKGGILHQLYIRFFYTEVSPSAGQSSHYIDLVFSPKRASTDEGSEKMKLEYNGNTFYQNLAAQLDPPPAGVVRYPDSVYYMFHVADKDFATFIDINKPSGSIVQERPAFSNISNGVGLFSARFSKIKYFKGLTARSIDTLIGGQYTYDLGFKDR
jgi:hypothetical protein